MLSFRNSIVIRLATCLRTVKVPASSCTTNEYVRLVEACRQDGKVNQRVVADLRRKDVLAALLPQLQRLLRGDDAIVGQEPQSDDQQIPGLEDHGGDCSVPWRWTQGETASAAGLQVLAEKRVMVRSNNGPLRGQ